VSRYVLDTTVLIDFARGRPDVVRRVLDLIGEGARVTVCAVSLTEYYTGVDHGTDHRMDAFIDRLGCVPVTRGAAMQAAAIRRAQRRAGFAVGLPDAVIAAVAQQSRATLLTANVKDFRLIDVPIEPLGVEG